MKNNRFFFGVVVAFVVLFMFFAFFFGFRVVRAFGVVRVPSVHSAAVSPARVVKPIRSAVSRHVLDVVTVRDHVVTAVVEHPVVVDHDGVGDITAVVGGTVVV
ncbi:MAG TPA: hypothetical protein VK557_09730 [Pyrinomonadaceae bacterium]|nr:hypothetical protein [Pyrinomonadaceae bacterium]